MKIKLTTIAIAVLVVGLVVATASADPLPGQLPKFVQKPMIATPIAAPGSERVVTYFGHDELSTAVLEPGGPATSYVTYVGQSWMADDFADHFDTPVVHVQWWGSYLNTSPATVGKFLIEFLADNPANPDIGTPSRPVDPPLLSQIVTAGPLAPASGTFTEVQVPGSSVVEPVYQYNAELKIPFQQKAETVYWLKIVALVDDPGTQWGWHNRDYTVIDPLASTPATGVVPGEHLAGIIPGPAAGDPVTPIWHFQDDAVQGLSVYVLINQDTGEIILDEDLDGSQPQLYRDAVDGPGPFAVDGVTFPGIGAYSKDLAFVLYTVPEPATLALLALGGLGVIGRAVRRRSVRRPD